MIDGLVLAGFSAFTAILVVAAQSFLNKQIDARLHDDTTGYMPRAVLNEKFKRIDEKLDTFGRRLDRAGSPQLVDELQKVAGRLELIERRLAKQDELSPS